MSEQARNQFTNELYAIKPDSNGWITLENGNRVRLGYGVKFGDNIELGNYVKIGDHVEIGSNVIIGNHVEIGNYSKISDDVKLNDLVKLGNYVKLGRKIILNGSVILEDGMTSLQMVKDIISGQPDVVYLTKWVTKDRLSPFWKDTAHALKYEKGAIVETEAEISDQINVPGIHVCLPGYSLCMAGFGYALDKKAREDIIGLRVEVKREDILYAGLPGNNIEWRVKRLKVLD